MRRESLEGRFDVAEGEVWRWRDGLVERRTGPDTWISYVLGTAHHLSDLSVRRPGEVFVGSSGILHYQEHQSTP